MDASSRSSGPVRRPSAGRRTLTDNEQQQRQLAKAALPKKPVDCLPPRPARNTSTNSGAKAQQQSSSSTSSHSRHSSAQAPQPGALSSSSSSSSSSAYSIEYGAAMSSYSHRHHANSSASSGSSSCHSSSSSYPSPSTSSTASSSLRTPPDLYPHGLSSSSTLSKTGIPSSKRFLSISEIDQRLQLLDTLASDLDDVLPTPPLASENASTKAAAGIDTKQPKNSGNAAGSITASASTETIKASKTATKTTVATRKDDTMSTDSKLSIATSSSSSSSSSSPAVSKKRSNKAATEEEEARASKPRDRIALEDEPSRKKVKSRASTNSRDYTPSPPPEATRDVKAVATSSSKKASSSSAKAVATAPPAHRTWTREQYATTGSLYQSKGRALKHAGDRRLREASSAYDASTTAASQQVAIYQHTEAILLFMYGFWCEDWAASLKMAAAGSASSSSRSCIVANWSSLSGLLHYVCANHEKHKNEALAGLCRLLEAMVLRHTACYEQKQLQHRLSRLAYKTSSQSATSGASPPSVTAASSPGALLASATSPAAEAGSIGSAPSPATNGHDGSSHGIDVSASISELASSMSRLVADEERSVKLFTQTRLQLSNAALASEFPKTWLLCQASILDPTRTANDLDPASAPVGSSSDAPLEEVPAAARWAWPLGAGEGQTLAAFPHVVNFGRSLLRESAQRKKLSSFRLADLAN